MGEVYTNQTFYDMMENENPVLEELKLRMGFTVGRKKEVQREILKIHERIATEVITPLIYPIDHVLTVPKYTYEPETEHTEGRFRFVSTWWLEMKVRELQVEGYWQAPTVEIDFSADWFMESDDKPEGLVTPWVIHSRHLCLETMAKLPNVLAGLFDAREEIDHMWVRLDRAIKHLKHELQVVCEVEMELKDQIDHILYGLDNE
jgi:hypothetical protein